MKYIVRDLNSKSCGFDVVASVGDGLLMALGVTTYRTLGGILLMFGADEDGPRMTRDGSLAVIDFSAAQDKRTRKECRMLYNQLKAYANTSSHKTARAPENTSAPDSSVKIAEGNKGR